MSDLDEVSLKIGQLSGQMQMQNQNFEHLITWIKESNGRIELALGNHSSEDKNNFKSLEEKVAKLDKFRVRALAVVSVCSLVLTAAVNFIIAHFSRNNG